MTYRRAVIPALAGGLLLTALLWWAGASTDALRLPGAQGVLGAQAAGDLERWLLPWSYESPESVALGGGNVVAVGGGRYVGLYATAMQIRFAAVFVFFVPGALLLVRRLPPVHGRVPATLLAVWAWGLVATTLAVTVSAPWLIASQGHGSYRFLPQLAGTITSGQQIAVVTGLVAAVAAVLVARVTVRGTGPLPREAVPVRASVWAATAGTLVVAFSLVVLSYESVAAELQTAFAGSGMFGEPGDLLREWLLLGGWAGPAGTPVGHWLLVRAADALLLAVVWCALRWLPGLLVRVTFPAMAVGAVCATVIGLLASQLLRMVTDGTDPRYGVVQRAAGLGGGVPAALTCGLVAGVVAAVTLRVAGGGVAKGDGAAAVEVPAGSAQQA
ncbi:hypothetical protein [Streptomyces beijiangensis]|uniref:Uncharacterized protein n=1 Tax=Streptomyces beijiangensis TaxID=163361 RepID=A0A939JKE3_9ACTN|nr:hypothetical protein [Streptomyces beijiangensis]MBO0514594.1 hypothetical protein [Streptomyces beijiangensis]